MSRMTEHMDPSHPVTPTGNRDLDRVAAGVANKLHHRGVEVFPTDTPEDLAALLDEVEAFERTVQEAGGDLMVAEPAQGHSVESGEGRAVAPGQSQFVIPGRHKGESVSDYLIRLRVATESVRRFPRRET